MTIDVKDASFCSGGQLIGLHHGNLFQLCWSVGWQRGNGERAMSEAGGEAKWTTRSTLRSCASRRKQAAKGVQSKVQRFQNSSRDKLPEPPAAVFIQQWGCITQS